MTDELNNAGETTSETQSPVIVELHLEEDSKDEVSAALGQILESFGKEILSIPEDSRFINIVSRLKAIRDALSYHGLLVTLMIELAPDAEVSAQLHIESRNSEGSE